MLSLEDSELSLKNSMNRVDCEMVPADQDYECSQTGNALRAEPREE